ncbi:hypothetical protein PR002_g24572 [Phytophthora rubi]|uniref:Uncharacterized protein n=1 Tax=Phytophthora rubi TaxID=129364 RepID=A0A6A3I7G2_9STRA|nr:hypothetical protein PR002_g24572 [Phytophthora rubi]
MFGEDPYLTSVMGASYVRRLHNQTAACIKHFIAYSKTPTGHDRDDNLISDFDLLNYFMSRTRLILRDFFIGKSTQSMLGENLEQKARLRESANRIIKMKLQLGLCGVW